MFSRFNSVLVKRAASLAAARLRQVTLNFGHAMRRSITSGLLLALPFCGVLACGSEIDNLAHVLNLTGSSFKALL